VANPIQSHAQLTAKPDTARHGSTKKERTVMKKRELLLLSGTTSAPELAIPLEDLKRRFGIFNSKLDTRII